MKKKKKKIEGMHCTGCSSRLEKVLNNTDGVESATVSFEKKQAIITYNESQTDIEQIKQIIQDTGFKGE